MLSPAYRAIPSSPRAVALLFALLLITAYAAAADEVEVNASRNGDEMTLTATMLAPVNPRVAWEVLTDFNRMAQWVPNLQESRIVSGPDERPMRLAQKGEIRVGLLTFAFESVREIEMIPTQSITVKGLSGNMRKLESTTRLSSEGEVTRLDYVLVFIPNYWIPPLIGPALIRRESRLQFEAIIAEMMRRGEPAK